MLKSLPLLGAALLLAACQPEQAAVPGAETPAKATSTGTIAAELHLHIAELASDAYEGREPGTPGEDKTVAYLVREFEALGLAPGNHGQWFQPVPITAVTTSPAAVLSLRGSDYAVDLSYGDEMVVSTARQVAQVSLEASPLVFAGYGINAPERGWNDYEGIDVTGKTVVVLVNDPGFATQDEALFNGNAMTYYGRWTYKYEEAARQGAAGVLIVHETAPAAYGWDVVRNSWTGAQIGLTADNRNEHLEAVRGWLPLAQAEALFSAAGLNYQALKAAAAAPGFRAVPLGDIHASVTLDNTLKNSVSRNVVALIEGSEYPDEVVIFSAHWDHLGVHPDEEGDNIYNGASDNASGTAALFSLARMFKQQPVAPQRSVMFLAVTAEESGLLGSQWYGENPVFPLARTVANLNMDNIAAGTVGLTSEVAVSGYGNSELDDYLREAAKTQGRKVVQEPFPEKGYYYRSDHFSLAKVGVPALYLRNSTASREHGHAWGEQRINEYYATHYHKPSDEYDPGWDLAGAAQEVELLYLVGTQLASSRAFPKWSPGVEFEAVREASLAAE